MDALDSAPRADPEGSIMGAVAAAYRGQLPERYRRSADAWRATFDDLLARTMAPGQRILDVGSGRLPTVPPEDRPPDCHYVGLDISREELETAPPGSYDEIFVADVRDRVASLEGRFDLVVSFQVLEHVKPLDAAFDNLRSYLDTDGQLVAQFSGKYSLFALANQAVPYQVSRWLLRHLLSRAEGTNFPAHYHLCYQDAIERVLRPWGRSEVMACWFGEGYFNFLAPLRAGYIGFEEWARRNDHKNLAPYYVVHAVR